MREGQEIPPPPAVLTALPHVTVARVALGLTLYLDEPMTWSQQGAAEVLSALIELLPPERLAWCTTSMIPDWHRVGPHTIEALLPQLSSMWFQQVRHLLWFRLVDDVHAPAASFSYREVDNARGGRSSWLQLFLPVEQGADDLMQLALRVGHEWPVLHGVAGYAASWNPHEKGTAFSAMRPWAKRWWGLDLQDPEGSSWHAERSLSGTGWLTLLGRRFLRLRGVDPESLAQRAWPHQVSAMRVRGGLILKAGPRPTLGDMNRLAFPHAYAAVGRALADLLPEAPPDFWGTWHTEKDALAWARRLVDPEGWR